MEIHASSLRNGVKFDLRVLGKNSGENKSKIAGCTAIPLLEALSGAYILLRYDNGIMAE